MIRRNPAVLRRWLTVLGVQAHAGQLRVLDAFGEGRRFIVVVCGRRWGKTLIAFVLAMYGLLERDARILVVSKTYRLASRVWAFLVPQVVRVFGPRARIYRGSYTIRTVWGAELVLGSADHPDSLLGTGWDLVVFDEAATCPEAIWQQYIRPALMDRRGSAIFITTPRGHNWIYDLYEAGQHEEAGDYWSIQAASGENPYLPVAELEAIRRELDPTTYRQEVEAQFVTMAGAVYATFARHTHCLDTRPDLTGWTISVAVDPGLANPTAMLWIAHNPLTGEDVVIDEVIRPGMLFPDVLRELQARRPPQGYDLMVCDIAGRARSQETGASFIGWMRSHGVRFVAHAGGIVDGVNVVRGRLLNTDGEVRLRFVAPACPRTVQALENYHYPEPIEGHPVSEEPEKDGVNDHPMDALRYYCTYRYTRRAGRSWIG